MRILITGGCGYVGTELVKSLIQKKIFVKVIDLMWFDSPLIYLKSKYLKILKKDYRDINAFDLKNIDCVIHLANVANDPSVELNPSLSWEINTLGMQILSEKCIMSKISKFIYASSGSVYGVKKEKEVTEKLSLEPISIYNKTKMTAERILLSYSKNLNSYIIRPATVCGFSERMRLDLSVNILTFSALKNKMITVFGGNQLRPNIHIKDMVRVYEHFLFKRNKTGIYNAGFENEKIINIAKKIQKKIECKIKVKNSNDPRSYRLNSDKLIKTGFKPHFGINDAIKELTLRYKKNELIDNPKSYNINWLKKKIEK